jgi:hypothetical protein
LSEASSTVTITVPNELPAVVEFGCPLKTNFVGVPTEMSNVLDVAAARDPLVACKRLPVPGLFTERLLKVANPPADVTCDSVPESVPPVLFVPNATATFTPLVDTALPEASSSCTVTVPSELPAVVDVGCPTNASFATVPTVILNGPDDAPVSEPLAATKVYPDPTLSTDNPVNVATPFTNDCAGVPPVSVAPLAFPNVSVTVDEL